MTKFSDFMRKSLTFAKQEGLTDNETFCVAGVICENGTPSDIFSQMNGNPSEMLGVLDILITQLEKNRSKILDQINNLMDKGTPVPELGERVSVKDINGPLSLSEKKELSDIGKKLVDKNIDPLERMNLLKRAAELMKKSVGKSNKSSSDDSDKINNNIEDFMKNLGKNFEGDSSSFTEGDLKDCV